MNINDPEPDHIYDPVERPVQCPSSISYKRSNSETEQDCTADSLTKYSPEAARDHGDKSYRFQQSISEPLLHQALHLFLCDTVIHTPYALQSKGHFVGLVGLVESSSKNEALPYALEAAALASFATRFHDSGARLQATHQYIASINRLRTTDLNSKLHAASMIACILLLSMYEITVANPSNALNWLQHTHGMIAIIKNFIKHKQLPDFGIPILILGSEPSPKLSSDVKENPSNQTISLVQTPTMPNVRDLWSILTKVQTMFGKSATILKPRSVRYESALTQLRDEAVALKSELLVWSITQPEVTRYRTIQHFTKSYILRFPGAEDFECKTTRADIYTDYFIACRWTSYRQCLLHLTDLLNRINRSLSKNPEAHYQTKEYAKSRKDIQVLIDDIYASIPFMLVGNGIQGNKPVGSIWFQARPPVLIGGINLQWILFTISILEIVPMNIRRDMKVALFWVGKNLGIGQATVLAQMPKNPPGGITAKGDALKWAGFFV